MKVSQALNPVPRLRPAARGSRAASLSGNEHFHAKSVSQPHTDNDHDNASEKGLDASQPVQAPRSTNRILEAVELKPVYVSPKNALAINTFLDVAYPELDDFLIDEFA